MLINAYLCLVLSAQDILSHLVPRTTLWVGTATPILMPTSIPPSPHFLFLVPLLGNMSIFLPLKAFPCQVSLGDCYQDFSWWDVMRGMVDSEHRCQDSRLVRGEQQEARREGDQHLGAQGLECHPQGSGLSPRVRAAPSEPLKKGSVVFLAVGKDFPTKETAIFVSELPGVPGMS